MERADEILPPDCQQDLADFTNLIATAISNVRTARGLAESQAALRRVATVVAQGAEPLSVFTTVAHEAARMLRVGAVSLVRYDPDQKVLTKIYGTHGERSAVLGRASWPLAESPELLAVVDTGGPARVNDWTEIHWPCRSGSPRLGVR